MIIALRSAREMAIPRVNSGRLLTDSSCDVGGTVREWRPGYYIKEKETLNWGSFSMEVWSVVLE